MLKICLFTALFFATFTPLAAQDAPELPAPQRVELTAVDGITMVSDFYPVPDAEGELPTVILLHGITGNRNDWNNLTPSMLENGFNVLAVDQRAHGESGGDRDLVAAIGDVQIWLDWLREQPSVEDNNISIIGSSWGTVPALAGCAADSACLTAIAISPGDFPLLDEAMFDSISDRSVLFIVGRRDTVLYDTKKLFERTSGEAAMYIYNTGLHGSAFFASRSSYRTSTLELVVNWLNDHLERPESTPTN